MLNEANSCRRVNVDKIVFLFSSEKLGTTALPPGAGGRDAGLQLTKILTVLASALLGEVAGINIQI